VAKMLRGKNAAQKLIAAASTSATLQSSARQVTGVLHHDTWNRHAGLDCDTACAAARASAFRARSFSSASSPASSTHRNWEGNNNKGGDQKSQPWGTLGAGIVASIGAVALGQEHSNAEEGTVLPLDLKIIGKTVAPFVQSRLPMLRMV
jgi:hypothetical protein